MEYSKNTFGPPYIFSSNLVISEFNRYLEVSSLSIAFSKVQTIKDKTFNLMCCITNRSCRQHNQQCVGVEPKLLFTTQETLLCFAS